jgi:hypothetical protein
MRKKTIEEFTADFLARLKHDKTGCWLWTGPVSWKGYGESTYGGQGRIRAHRASWIIHNGEVPDGLWVLHKCDVRLCCNPAHLYLGRITDNTRDAMERNRVARGPRNAASKLDADAVLHIRSSDETCRALAKKYGVSATAISKVKTSKNWAHIPTPR